jgi:transcription-repair coupling factor (superfamily II helicase)
LEIKELIQQICSQEGFVELLSKLESGEKRINLKNIAGSLSGVLAAGVVAQKQGTHIFILSDNDDAAYFYNDLYKLLHPSQEGDETNHTLHDNVLFFPSSFKRSSKYGREDFSNIVQRTQVMERLKTNTGMLAVVTYPEAVAETVPSNEDLKKYTLQLTVGEKTEMDFLMELFEEYKFERSDFVYEPGQYAIRGGIIDVFSFSSNKPYRLEFFGDELESIRSFDVNSQLSDAKLQTVAITSNIRSINDNKKIPFTDCVPDGAVVWTENHKIVADMIDNLYENQPLSPQNETTANLPELITGRTFKDSLNRLVSIKLHASKSENGISFNSVSQPVFNKKFEMLAQDIISRNNEGYTVLILAENTNQIERLRNIFGSVSKTNVRFIHVKTSIHQGFIDKRTKICCYTDHQIFQRYHRYRIRGEVDKSDIITLHELTSLNVGDYVVHIDHGIGIFGGLVKIELNGKRQEAVRITYQDNDTIFVDLQGLHRISKYRGRDGSPPKIHKPGSGVWNRIKQSVKKKIKDIAGELILLYAKRRETQGFAYSPDSFLQQELEASFIYEDTPDQLKTTKAVKQDMEQNYPMDRLVCGDVGFGKTEIAIRAAFKAVTDGKQVAVLVPTTILALQHYKSFTSRLAEFPVTIDFISRMKSAKDIRHSLEILKRGKTDIIIGTHRLLSQDVEFKDLGLLVIDEEQHFGVSSKEKIRKKKVNVDTLTLTATPIPRTLQFSLLGARDLSVINTPPPNRIPITTEAHTFSEIIIKDAIDYEVKRGGQVFFIHNRIKDIQAIETLVKRISPEAKTVIAHGQTDSALLEDIMTDFIDGQYDVLIATTIIESGLDIPNANTIIINQAQNFGLSELHQLRGRVGRSNKKAYCYLLTPPLTTLTPDARRRLKAIEEFSDLGSGFNISMQDLDIRGAGNLLGGEQSGFIAEIGFEAYQRILNEAIMELRGERSLESETPQEETEYVTDSVIDSDIEANLPDEYVSNKSEKLRLYREIDSFDSSEQVSQFETELIDRFGPLPKATEELLQGVILRKSAIKSGFERVVLKNKLMFLHFPSNQRSPYYSSTTFHNILQYIHGDSHRFTLKDKNMKLSLLVRDVNSHKEAVEILTKMNGGKKE